MSGVQERGMTSGGAPTGPEVVAASPMPAEELRAALYAGALLRLLPSPGSLALVARARALLQAELGPAPREAYLKMAPSALFAALGAGAAGALPLA
jgi:hypothetical protein